MDSRLRGNDSETATSFLRPLSSFPRPLSSFPRRRESIEKLYNTSILPYTKHELEKRQIEMHPLNRCVFSSLRRTKQSVILFSGLLRKLAMTVGINCHLSRNDVSILERHNRLSCPTAFLCNLSGRNYLFESQPYKIWHIESDGSVRV